MKPNERFLPNLDAFCASFILAKLYVIWPNVFWEYNCDADEDKISAILSNDKNPPALASSDWEPINFWKKFSPLVSPWPIAPELSPNIPLIALPNVGATLAKP